LILLQWLCQSRLPSPLSIAPHLRCLTSAERDDVYNWGAVRDEFDEPGYSIVNMCVCVCLYVWGARVDLGAQVLASCAGELCLRHLDAVRPSTASRCELIDLSFATS
jgi:hypothetical protein